MYFIMSTSDKYIILLLSQDRREVSIFIDFYFSVIDNYHFLIRPQTTVKILLLPNKKFSSLPGAFHGYFSFAINCIHFLSVD